MKIIACGLKILGKNHI